MLVYKLTDQENKTFNNTVWGEGVTHKTNGQVALCSPGWLHFYTSPELAVLLNPIHVMIKTPKLWEAEARGQIKYDKGLKGGCTELTTIREIPIPEYTPSQKIAFGILCALEVFKETKFVEWANNWLTRKDRSTAAAVATYATAAAISYDAAADADAEITYAADAAASAASAAYAADITSAAAAAAHTAVYASVCATSVVNAVLDLQNIAMKAKEYA